MSTSNIDPSTGQLAERERLLRHIVRLLQHDPRVVAVWLGGSLGRGIADRWSDIDIEMVMDDIEMDAIRSDPLSFVADLVSPLMTIEAPQNAPPSGAYLLTLVSGDSGPQQIDWYWHPVSSATRPGDTQLVFERVAIPVDGEWPLLESAEVQQELAALIRDALLMASLSGKHIRRGNGWSTIRYLEYLSTLVAKAGWMETHASQPDFATSRSLHPGGNPPINPREQAQFVLNELQTLNDLTKRHTPELRQALAEITDWINQIQS